MTKKAMNEFLKSDFYNELCGLVKAWDYYLKVGNKEFADQMMHKWSIAKLALKHITGKTYGFSRDGVGKFSIVNEHDYDDRLCQGDNSMASGYFAK